MEFTGSLYLILICLILFQGITACVHPDKKAINKIRIKLEKIKEINYRLSLRKIPPEDAALKISVYIQDLQKLNLKVSEDEAFQELLNSFLEKWHSEERVQESLQMVIKSL
ncbi:MAG: hypothetical protein IPM26_08030 [Saprospiraceae bacterium]|nr:hypothetical protein [Saprospiraceae bacterium]